jgi:hypothetical protein
MTPEQIAIIKQIKERATLINDTAILNWAKILLGEVKLREYSAP